MVVGFENDDGEATEQRGDFDNEELEDCFLLDEIGDGMDGIVEIVDELSLHDRGGGSVERLLY